MWKWLRDRFSEPTTMIGIAAVVAGAGQVMKINEAPQIAEAIAMASQPVATGDYVTSAAMLFGGILAAFMKEKGGK